MSTTRFMILMFVVAVVMSGCSAAVDDEVSDTQPVSTSSTTTSIAPTTSSPSSTTTLPPASEEVESLEIVRERDVVYLEDADGTWTMDVFHPTTGGPWPLVVVYHGMTGSRSTIEARRIAESGAVAVAPQWLKELPPTMTPEEFISGDLMDRAACATYAAQHLAADISADPERTTVAGISAGSAAAAWIGLGVVREDVCDLPMLHKPIGTVLGDSQLIFFDEYWDSSFADPASPAQDTTDRLVNPDRWDLDADATFYLWSSDYVYARDITNPPDGDSWIWSRDTTGDLVEDLGAVFSFDNERIGWKDNARLLAMRLEEAGYPVIHEGVGGSHAYSDAVYEGIDALIHPDALKVGADYQWPSSSELQAVAAAFCDAWPEIDGVVDERVALALVPDAGWDPEADTVTYGSDAVMTDIAAISEEYPTAACGTPIFTDGDWAAVPAMMYGDAGATREGIWVLKVSRSGLVTWVMMYGTPINGDQPATAPPEGEPDGELLAEAHAFCQTIEGTGYVRDADEFLAFMSEDPAAHAIGNAYHVVGEQGVRDMIVLYPPGDQISCDPFGTTNGVWSATGTALAHPEYTIYMEGITVHQHTDDGIRRLYYHWTDAGMEPGYGVGTWGLPPNP